MKSLPFDLKKQKNFENKFKWIYVLSLPVIFSIFKPKIFGKENIPYQNGLLLASNHLYNNDQYVISYAFGNRPFQGLASSTIKETFRGKLFDKIGAAIYVDRLNEESKKNAEEEIEIRVSNNKNVIIFPEGTRKDKDEEGKKKFLLPFKYGILSIAQKTGAPIIPMAINYKCGFLKKRTYVRIGKVMMIKPDDNLEIKKQILEEQIALLKLENIEYDTLKYNKLIKKMKLED